jgi:tRNA nucleotidyltransferase (CCA-adding enzyme)
LATPKPEAFFTTLRHCGALQRIMPELDRLWGIPQPAKWHPEIDCGVHSMLALQAACALSESLEIRFAALTHDLGKGTTPRELLPGHPGHEERGVGLIDRLCRRLRLPNSFRRLAVLSSRFHTHCHRLLELRAQTILRTLERMDAFRSPERFRDFLTVCKADFRGRQGAENREYPQAEQFLDLFEQARQVDKSRLRHLPEGKVVGQALHELRLQAIKSASRDQPVRR